MHPIAKRASVVGAVLLLLVAGPSGSARAECQEFEKQVSIDGGLSWLDADDPAVSPVQIVGVGVVYRFIVTNCLTDKLCFDTRIDDPTLGISALVGDGIIEPLEQVVVTSEDPGFENLDQPDRCDTPGLKLNEATETTRVEGSSAIEQFTDPAYVECVEPDDAALGDRVWEDLNADGKQDAGEPGIPDVAVELLNPGTDGTCATGDDTVLATTTTGADGFYLFDRLPAGDYCVTFPQDPAEALGCPIGSNASYTIKNALGVDPADDSNANPDGTTDAVGLAAGGEDLTIDAGLFCSVSLGDTLWNDLDRDGVQDGLNQPDGEPGIDGVQVTLFDCDGNQLGASTLTGPAPAGAAFPQSEGGAGWYQFSGLVPGCYVVSFDQPASFVFSPADQGIDDELDSDVNPAGFTGPIQLASGESDQTVDAGVNQPPAGLGDFVFEDLDADGIQDSNEPGIPDVPVELLTPGNDGVCNTSDDVSTGLATITDAQGMYLFEGLDPGRYCVEFDKAGIDCRNGVFDLGDASFSPAGVGADPSVDSNPDPATGVSGDVDLDPGEFDPTIDAGIFCPAKLGDRVWEDGDNDGLQGPDEPGLEGVVVTLLECGPDGIAGTSDDVDTGQTRTTNGGDGMYMFGAEPDFELAPGQYYVQFTDPEGREFTTPGASPDDRNSDCRPPDGGTTCTSLESREVDLDIDCGLLPPPPPECDLRLDKKCQVETPPPPVLSGKCQGRIQEFSMVWNGSGPISIAGVGSLTTSASSVAPGEEVTFFNNDGGSNDVFVEISGAVEGTSTFHLSCSDDDMDTDTESNQEQPQVSPQGQDCGKRQGNGKAKEGFINDWIFEGLVDADGAVLDCTPAPPGDFADACEFERAVVSCETTGKPTTLTLRYAGEGPVADCLDNSASRANQKPPTCSGNLPVGATVSIELNGGTASPTMVAPGESFDITGFGSQTEITLTGGGGMEFDSFHTSCSAPLEVGDVFGNLTVVAFDGQRSSATVTYQYEVTNLGDPVTNVLVTDDKLGPIGTIPVLPDASGNSAVLTAVTEIDETTVNTAMAMGELSNGAVCAAPPDSVTVTQVEPSCNLTQAFKELRDDAVKYDVTNLGSLTATLESLQLSFPAEFGAVREVKRGGDVIFKSSDSSVFPGGVPSGATIGAGDWTQSDVSKREIDPGNTETLEVKFVDKFTGAEPDDFAGQIGFGGSCSSVIPVPEPIAAHGLLAGIALLAALRSRALRR